MENLTLNITDIVIQTEGGNTAKVYSVLKMMSIITIQRDLTNFVLRINF